MRILIVSCYDDFADQIIELLDQDDHQILFVHTGGTATPFTYHANFAVIPEQPMVDAVNNFADTFNAYESVKDRYQEKEFPDPDELYAMLGEIEDEFKPDHVIRRISDFVIC